jgi:ligand-binding sensor domain-containing protein
VQNLRFERISIAQGLSHSTVNCILQDSYGFMWFGTDDGLNRHDGHDFALYNHDPDDPHSLSHNQIKSLHQDQLGTLWVGTVDRLGDDWHLGVRYNQGVDYVNQREAMKGI